MPKKIVISGATGRMGQTLVRLIGEDSNFELLGGIDRERADSATAKRYGCNVSETADTAVDLVRAADAIADLSAVAGLGGLLRARADDVRGNAVAAGRTARPAQAQHPTAQP